MNAVLSAALFGAAALGFGGCAQQRPVESTDLDHGVLFVSMNLKGKYRQTYRAAEVDFVRISPSGGFTEDYLPSNLSVKGEDGRRYVFLTDVPPGRYAVSVVRFPSVRGKFEVWVPTMSAVATITELPAGKAAYMGHFEFSRVVEGSWRRRNFRARGSKVKATLERARGGHEDLVKAYRTAARRLSGTLWEDALARQLETLGPAREPILEGAWWRREKNKKKVPYQSYNSIYYLDIMDWASPFKVPGGLEWREPKGRARVALVLLTPGMEGYRPKEEYLKYLKSLSSNEDSEPVEQSLFDSKPAYRLRTTTYVYPEGTLVGSDVETFRTETLVVPLEKGHLLIHYRAKKRHFSRFYDEFRRFRKYILTEEPVDEKRL